MAWTNPRTWVAGELVTASQLNTHLRDNELDLDARAHHVLQHDQTTAGTPADTAEHVLHAFTIPANYFAVNGRSVRLTATGTVPTGNGKWVRMRLGGSSGAIVADSYGQMAGVWWMQTVIARVGLNTQWGVGVAAGVDHTGFVRAVGGQTTQVEASALELVVTGTNETATANDVIYQAGWLEFMGA